MRGRDIDVGRRRGWPREPAGIARLVVIGLVVGAGDEVTGLLPAAQFFCLYFLLVKRHTGRGCAVSRGLFDLRPMYGDCTAKYRTGAVHLPNVHLPFIYRTIYDWLSYDLRLITAQSYARYRTRYRTTPHTTRPGGVRTAAALYRLSGRPSAELLTHVSPDRTSRALRWHRRV